MACRIKRRSDTAIPERLLLGYDIIKFGEVTQKNLNFEFIIEVFCLNWKLVISIDIHCLIGYCDSDWSTMFVES